MINPELDRDISVALKFLYKVPLTDEEKCIYDRIYPWSNEPIFRYYDRYDLEDKKTLCITSSMDHALYAASAGAKEIDCIDRNKLCKYYGALKTALIKAYDEENFFEHFSHKGRRILTKKLNITAISPFLSDDEYTFWNELMSAKAFKFNKRLFRNDGSPLRFLLDYETLRQQLQTIKINYFDADIINLKNITDDKYDAIFLSNVLEWEKEEKRTKSFHKIYDLLNKDGLLYDAHVRRDIHHAEPFIEPKEKLYTGPTFHDSIALCTDGVYIYKKK